jgi:hypothetical protein
VQLLENEDGRTLLKYEGDMQVGGRLASVGQRLIDTASKSMIQQGLESLNNSLRARAEAEAEGIEVEYVPPSEAKFAAAVARDMAKEMMPPPQTMELVVVVAVLAFLIGFLLGSRGKD